MLRHLTMTQHNFPTDIVAVFFEFVPTNALLFLLPIQKRKSELRNLFHNYVIPSQNDTFTLNVQQMITNYDLESIIYLLKFEGTELGEFRLSLFPHSAYRDEVEDMVTRAFRSGDDHFVDKLVETEKISRSRCALLDSQIDNDYERIVNKYDSDDLDEYYDFCDYMSGVMQAC
uniref:Uncharacterized protein n=1 Tax=Percolomonas cosmopolitus TaxID=63605 RepID=A0A7S1PHX3_9EUKA